MESRAQAYAVVDYHSSYILDQRNAESKQPIASLTKVATACVVLDWMDRTEHGPNWLITVPPGVAQTPGNNPIGLQVGDRISLRDALYAALMTSDNHAALTLANAVGTDLMRQRSMGGQPITAFIQEMNALAARLQMLNTRFYDPHGLGDPRGNLSVSTAKDLARLTIYAMGKSSFRFYVSQQTRVITVQSAAGPRRLQLKNTNEVLGSRKVDGVKTGYTSAAGPCVILSAPRDASVMRNAQGQEFVMPHRLVVVLLNSPSRFEQAAGLLQSGWQRYDAWIAGGQQIESSQQMLGRTDGS